jgi:hypothetical protein
MKFSRSLLGCLALLVAMTGAFAAVPATNAPPATPSPPAEGSRRPPGDGAGRPALGDRGLPTDATAPAAARPASKLDDYIKDLTAALKLTDTEKKRIEAYYVADGVQLKNILNDDTLSPLQQARQVSDLRDTRNIKIESLLDDLDRQHEFRKIEARYRVALTELAANGGIVPPPPPPPVPASAVAVPATNAPPTAK